MPKRPASHVLEDRARKRLTDVLDERGWLWERIARDYGEDLLVRIVDDGHVTPLFFFIQSKACSRVDELLIRGGRYISVSVSADHVRTWNEFWQPVLLTVWDKVLDRTYWECVQTAVTIDSYRKKPATSVNTTRVWIPSVNILNATSLARIQTRTESRFIRYQRECEGAEILKRALRDQLGMEIDYDPKYGLLSVPRGTFTPHPSGENVIHPFGRFLRELETKAALAGCSVQDVFDFMTHGLDDLLSVLRGEEVTFRGGDRNVPRVLRTPRDLINDFIDAMERSDEEPL
jgi:Domain of unknown function (DUF4365)